MERFLSMLIGDQWLLTPVVIFLATFILIYSLSKWLRTSQLGPVCSEGGKRLLYPPSIGCLPIIGSIPYLPRSLADLHTFCLKKTYSLGGVFSMRVGQKLVVFLSTHESIKEAFAKAAFSDRPEHFWDALINPLSKGIVFHHYDADFKRFHKVSLQILKEFGFGQAVMETRITKEAAALVEKVKETNGKEFSPKYMIELAIANVIAGTVFGQRITPETTIEFFQSIQTINDIILTLVPLDILPALRHTKQFRNRIEKISSSRKKACALIDKKIDEMRCYDKEDNYISYFMHHEGKEFDREQLIMMVMELAMGGSDTSSTTMMWALLAVANNPDVQKRMQQDIDATVPRERLPLLSDKAKMPYIEATILEVFRYKTLVPTGVPHATLCDTEVGGYHIPKDTMVMSVLYAAHMNKNVWSDPEEFRPERFLDDSGNVVKKDLIMSFSTGKRSCMGEQLARQEVFLLLTSLVQQFCIRPPVGCDKVDYKEEVKSLLCPTYFELRFLPREES